MNIYKSVCVDYVLYKVFGTKKTPIIRRGQSDLNTFCNQQILHKATSICLLQMMLFKVIFLFLSFLQCDFLKQ